MAWVDAVQKNGSVDTPANWRQRGRPCPATSPLGGFAGAFTQKQRRLTPWDVDDNREIVRIIQAESGSAEVVGAITQRMTEGAKKYGHGVRVGDDTRQYKSVHDSWLEHALQENLDGVVYLGCAVARARGGPREKAYRNALLHQIAMCRDLIRLLAEEVEASHGKH